MKRISIFSPHIKEDIIEELGRTFRSRWINVGKKVEDFETNYILIPISNTSSTCSSFPFQSLNILAYFNFCSKFIANCRFKEILYKNF